jgi:hypothetical protein
VCVRVCVCVYVCECFSVDILHGHVSVFKHACAKCSMHTLTCSSMHVSNALFLAVYA